MTALVKLPITDLVRPHLEVEQWPGLVIDVAEDQIVKDSPLATEMAKKLAPVKVKLAVDDFGRGYSSLARLKELPFAELKLDRTFVTDCGTDKVNAPLCKTVIDLAHNFGSHAVAIGIEKAGRCAGAHQHGLRHRPRFSPRPADARRSVRVTTAPARGRARQAAAGGSHRLIARPQAQCVQARAA